MSLNRRQLRTPRRIERWPPRPLARRRGQSVTERVAAWRAENWNNP